MGVMINVRLQMRSAAIDRQARVRLHLLTGALVAGLALTFAATGHAACSGNECAVAQKERVAAAEPETAAPGRPVKLNAFNKRTAKPVAVTKRKVANKSAINSKYATKRAAKYARIANRVQKAGKKFAAPQPETAVASASSNTKTPSPASVSGSDSLKPLVADARAEMSEADLKAAGALSSNSVTVADAGTPANMQVVSADQVNDIDRAAVAAAAPEPPARQSQVLKPVNPDRATVAANDSAWDQTSFIGKLFVAFGGLLTLASAARMFIA